jgi:hypothetical protein
MSKLQIAKVAGIGFFSRVNSNMSCQLKKESNDNLEQW